MAEIEEIEEDLLPNHHEMSDLGTLGTFEQIKKERSGARRSHILLVLFIVLFVAAGSFLAGHYSTSSSNNCPKKEALQRPGTTLLPTTKQEATTYNALPGEPIHLSAANNAFKEVYDRNRGLQIEKKLFDGPVFWGNYNRSHIGLIWQGKIEFKESTPPVYTILKDVCHQALATYLMFNWVTDTPLNSSFMANVRRYLNLVMVARTTLPGLTSINSTQKARQLNMSDDITNFLKTIQSRNPPRVSRLELDRFAHDFQARILLNVQEATNAMLDRWLEIVTEWRKRFDKNTWAKAKAFTPTSPMARESLAKLFFVGALGASGNNGDRIFPAVGTSGINLDFLERIGATYLTDFDLGEKFLNNPYTMTYDLLHNSTVRHMNKLKAKKEVPIRTPLLSKRSTGCPFY